MFGNRKGHDAQAFGGGVKDPRHGLASAFQTGQEVAHRRKRYAQKHFNMDHHPRNIDEMVTESAGVTVLKAGKQLIDQHGNYEFKEFTSEECPDGEHIVASIGGKMQPISRTRGIRLIDDAVATEIHRHNVEESEYVMRLGKMYLEGGSELVKYMNPLLFRKLSAMNPPATPDSLSSFPETSDMYSKLLHSFLLAVKETAAEATFQSGNIPNLHGVRMLDPFPAQTPA